ncbi:glycosyltransferase family 87 protein [Streptomyces sp. NPDC001530]|uniref:glycosyltransferase family 87 protein n=1 Tax=Streptomyces sp. NPDC001530 TaxID=3364582 RepID=UPI003689972E
MNEGKSDISGWLAHRASWHAWAVLAVVLCVPVVNVVRRSRDGGMDNAIVVRAARTWLDGGSPYADPHFLYLPGAVLAAVPQALLPLAALRVLVPLTVTGLLVVGWACALRIHGIVWRSRFGVLGLIALALGFAPFGHLVTLGNWTVTAAAALPLGLLCAVRGRWVAAGAVIGAAIVLKPLLAPVALLFVFARRWRGLGSLVLVPAVVSGGAALLMPDPAGFVTRTLPFLLRGHDRFVRLYEASPGAVLARLGVPQGVASLVAFVAAGAGVWCAYRRWRRADPGPLRVVETAVMLMLSAFLVSRPSYDHYLLVVVPLLVAGVPFPGAVARSPWFWVALVPQVPGVTWPYLEPLTRRAFRDCVALCVLFAAVAVRPELSVTRRPALQAVPTLPQALDSARAGGTPIALRDDCPQQ